MPILFFALAIALLSYANEEPSCYAGAVIFGILGFLFINTGLPKEKESLFKKKKNSKL